MVKLRRVAQSADLAKRQSELRDAASDLASGIQQVGLDRWARFLDDAERRADNPATAAAVEKSRQPTTPGKDAIRPVPFGPVEALLAAGGVAAAAVKGGIAAGAGTLARTVTRQLSPKPKPAEPKADAKPPPDKPNRNPFGIPDDYVLRASRKGGGIKPGFPG